MNKKHDKALRALIKDGLQFGDAVNVFADHAHAAHLKYARLAQVSESDNGAYVMAWLWVESPDNDEDSKEEETT